MVNKHLTVKIGDFGLSRGLLKSDYYRQTSQMPVAFRWVAPECWNEQKFSSKSDVYSFGMTLLEIVTFGAEPYGVSLASTISLYNE